MKPLLIVFVLICSCYSDGQSLSTLLRQPAPPVATLFAPRLISDGLNNRDFTISPDGNEMFYTIQSGKFLTSTIVHRVKRNGHWSEPQIAEFSGKYRDLEAFFAPDGKTVFFSSDRPVEGKDSVPDFDIWKVERKATGWTKPVSLGAPVNSEKNEFYPSVSKSGTIYFTAEPEGGLGEEDIVRCRWSGGHYKEREILDSAVNTKGDEFNAFIDTDEQFIIFSSYKGRPDEQGGGDLYISYEQDGKWSKALNMRSVNTLYLDYCPFVTADKKRLFFASNRSNLKAKHPEQYASLTRALRSAGNGTDDIYWIDFSKILE